MPSSTDFSVVHVKRLSSNFQVSKATTKQNFKNFAIACKSVQKDFRTYAKNNVENLICFLYAIIRKIHKKWKWYTNDNSIMIYNMKNDITQCNSTKFFFVFYLPWNFAES